MIMARINHQCNECGLNNHSKRKDMCSSAGLIGRWALSTGLEAAVHFGFAAANAAIHTGMVFSLVAETEQLPLQLA